MVIMSLSKHVVNLKLTFFVELSTSDGLNLEIQTQVKQCTHQQTFLQSKLLSHLHGIITGNLKNHKMQSELEL